MQGLLARLKTLNQANPDLPNIYDDGGRSKLDANNYTRTEDVKDVKQISTPLQNGLSIESIDKLSDYSTSRTESRATVLRQHTKNSRLSGEKIKLSDIRTNVARLSYELK